MTPKLVWRKALAYAKIVQVKRNAKNNSLIF